MNQSVTISGAVVLVLSMVFTPEEAGALVTAAVAAAKAVGIIMVYWGRYRHGDITFWGQKK